MREYLGFFAGSMMMTVNQQLPHTLWGILSPYPLRDRITVYISSNIFAD
jgi:hypothetical protein